MLHICLWFFFYLIPTCTIRIPRKLCKQTANIMYLQMTVWERLHNSYMPAETELTVRDVKQGCELVLGGRDFLDVGQMEKTRWQTGELVVREIYLLQTEAQHTNRKLRPDPFLNETISCFTFMQNKIRTAAVLSCVYYSCVLIKEHTLWLFKKYVWHVTQSVRENQY